MRQVIRYTGEMIDLLTPETTQVLRKRINAETLDTVALRHMGNPLHVMLIDDSGYEKGLPVNGEATRLYHLNCKPGTTHQILGDVVIIPDEDFA